MSDNQHSESEFYYPEKGNLNVSLRNEKFKASEAFEASEVLNNNKFKNYKMPYNKQLINLDRSVFTDL